MAEPGVDCETLTSRYGAPERLESGRPVVATFDGMMGVSVASAITKQTYTVVDPLESGLAVSETIERTKHGAGAPRHPNVEPSRSMLDASRERADLVGQTFVVVLEPSGDAILGVVPALDEKEARALASLVSSETCR